jgi:hypothetical protein
LPGVLTPQVQEQLAHLGTWMPFEPAARMLARFTQVHVSEATARRLTEVVGRAYEAVQQAEIAALLDELPAVPAGPAQAVLSVDGAMVPLRGGEWAEVKTLAVGEVLPQAPAPPGTEACVFPEEGVALAQGRTTALSYCSRLADVEHFNIAVLGELHRRGIEQAGQVAAVSDGAEWIQGFFDLHCPQAVRILDFPHAAERVALIGQAVAPGAPTWLPQQLHRLKHAGPNPLLSELHHQVAAHPEPPAEVIEALTYLDKRTGHMQYPAYQAAGWPIGSGMVESANKLVVEARFKGAGMHWARHNVNPLLTLRNAACNDRWDEAWALSTAYLRQHPLVRCPPPPSDHSPTLPTSPPPPLPPATPSAPSGPSIPARTHPWRTYGQKLSAKR